MRINNRTHRVLCFVSAVILLFVCSKKSGQESPDTLADGRDGKTYRKVRIGDQVWMAENLNYKPKTGRSWCYSNSDSYCAQYGRLYDWETAKTVCPNGWHLPSREEWNELVIYAGDYDGRKLKSVNGWDYYSDSYYGTDAYGFSALPGGYRGPDDKFYIASSCGYWWSATEIGRAHV
jgi:uncharacterized protein (TIGR02145 family)